MNSSRPKVYVTRQIPEKGLKILGEVAMVRVHSRKTPPSKEEIIREVRGVDGLLCMAMDQIDSDVIQKAEHLKVISNYAVGFDNIDLSAATKRESYVTNTPGILTEAVADFAWALLLAVARRVVEADKFVRAGEWKWRDPGLFVGCDVHGKTLGIVGLGRIGEAVARRAKGFNMRVLYYDKHRKLEVERALDLKFVSLETLLKESDYVSLHVPVTNETYHLIGEKELSMMKRDAFLINTARGPVVDEVALFKSLKSKAVAGAALDVFETEPLTPDNALLGLDNVIVAPHIGSATYETREKMAVMAAENLKAALMGEVPPNLVNRDVLKVRAPRR